MAITPSQVRHLVDRAVRIAREHRTVTCLVFPNDVQDMKAVPTPPREHGTVRRGRPPRHDDDEEHWNEISSRT